MEFAHGAARSDSPARNARRRHFIEDLIYAVDPTPVSTSIALKAGLLDGELASAGIQVAFPDLLIGVTALELGYSVLTANLRHFERIPDLKVVQHSSR